VRLGGEFDMSDESSFSAVVIDGVLNRSHAAVRLDVAELTFLDSVGLRCFVRAKTKADALGLRFTIDGRQPAVRRVLETTDLAGWFQVDPYVWPVCGGGNPASMATDGFESPSYYLDHFSRVDDGKWFLVVFRDPAEGGTGGLTVAVSADALSSLLRQGRTHALSGPDLMALDGK
jgi:anti-anti-sigma factor